MKKTHSIFIPVFYLLTLLLTRAIFFARFVFFYDWPLADDILAGVIAAVVLIVRYLVFVSCCKKNAQNIIITTKLLNFDIILHICLFIYIGISLLCSMAHLEFMFVIFAKVTFQWAYLELITIVMTVATCYLIKSRINADR